MQPHSPCMDDLGNTRPAEIWFDWTVDLFMLCSYIVGWLMIRERGMYNIISILMILDDSRLCTLHDAKVKNRGCFIEWPG